MERIAVSMGGGIQVPLNFSGQLVIGRDPNNDVVLMDKTVSRRHATLWRKSQSSWRVLDHQSRNGTWVNGVRVRTEAPVQPGDTLTFGRVNVTFANLGGAFTIGPTQKDTQRALSPLTSREESVLRLVALGHADKQIAADLVISVRTVQAHLDSIRNKVGLRRRPDLTKYALQSGVVTAEELIRGGT